MPRVATLLGEAGVGPGDRVLIWAVPRPEWGIASLGAQWARAISVPIDVRSTDAFASKLAAQTRPKLVLASMPTLKSASRLELPVVTVESLVDRAAGAAVAPPPQTDPDGLAEIVFTSGTTGDPKGIVHTHQNVLASLRPIETEMGKYLRYERFVHPIRILHTLPLSHVFGQFMGILVPQLLGGEVFFQESLNPSQIIETIKRERISIAFNASNS